MYIYIYVYIYLYTYTRAFHVLWRYQHSLHGICAFNLHICFAIGVLQASGHVQRQRRSGSDAGESAVAGHQFLSLSWKGDYPLVIKHG